MSTLVAQTISNGTVSTSTANVINGAKVWVNFNGTTSPGTIRASYNVSSVTKNGTGDYTVNFTTAFTDANYSMIGASSLPAGGSDRRVVATNLNTAPTTSAIRISVGFSSTADDQTYVQIAIFR